MANPLARMSAVGSGLKVIGDAAKRALLFKKTKQLLKRTTKPSPAALYGKGQFRR